MNKRISARTLNFYDKEVVSNIVEKYGMDERKDICYFLTSETYQKSTDYFRYVGNREGDR